MNKNVGFLDLLFNMLLGFVILTMISFFLIRPSTSESEGVKNKAEYMINVTWGDEYDVDVDTWIQDPLGNVMYFREKDRPVFTQLLI